MENRWASPDSRAGAAAVATGELIVPFGIVDIIVILLITVGPLKALIVYATLAGGAEPALRRQIAFRTVLIALIVTLLFVVAGEFILKVLHISLPALKIAGGIILMLFAIGMVMGDSHGKDDGALKKITIDVAAYPLAIPLMATPQGLVAITAITAAMTTRMQVLVVAAIVAGIMAFNLVCLLMADRIIKALGAATLQIVARVFGLLLTALAIQLMILGFIDLGLIEKALGH
jgi:multiple antibiotic resistance protein